MTELEDLEARRDRAWRECLYLDGQIFRLKQKPLTEEEREASLKVCRSIGRKLKDKWKVGGWKEIKYEIQT